MKQHDLLLPRLSRHHWQAISVPNFGTFTVLVTYMHSQTLKVYGKIASVARGFMFGWRIHALSLPGRVAQSVTCLATDASLTADQGVASLIPARSHTFVEIDREIISTVNLLPSAESFKKGCCQLQAKVCSRSTG